MPINISLVLTKDLGLMLEMIFTLRPFPVLRSFCCPERLGKRNSFVEPTGSDSLILPLNYY